LIVCLSLSTHCFSEHKQSHLSEASNSSELQSFGKKKFNALHANAENKILFFGVSNFFNQLILVLAPDNDALERRKPSDGGAAPGHLRGQRRPCSQFQERPRVAFIWSKPVRGVWDVNCRTRVGSLTCADMLLRMDLLEPRLYRRRFLLSFI
jgi:hypothetical protein